MAGTVFIAGASGVVGRPLCELLIADGWTVFGSTRTPAKADLLRRIGVEPVLVDVFDARALQAAVLRAKPQAIIHQLTDLPDALDPLQMPAALVRNARLRDEGTRNLIEAATVAGVKRLIAQSIAFVYAAGSMPYDEEAALDDGPGPYAVTVAAVKSLESQVLSASLEGLVLRYGKFYGPGTGFDTAPAGGPVHVDAAADAARRALARGSVGLYNVAEDDGTVSSAKAIRELGWSPEFRRVRSA